MKYNINVIKSAWRRINRHDTDILGLIAHQFAGQRQQGTGRNQQTKHKLESTQMPNTTEKTCWVVTAPSAYRPGHTCFLGRGTTRQHAMEEAFGAPPWGPAAKKSMRIASVYQVNEDEADNLEHGEA